MLDIVKRTVFSMSAHVVGEGEPGRIAVVVPPLTRGTESERSSCGQTKAGRANAAGLSQNLHPPEKHLYACAI
jgi:hypothetical protein